MSKEPMRPKFDVTTRVMVELDLIVRLENGANCTFGTAAELAPGLAEKFIAEAVIRTAKSQEAGHKLIGSPSVQVVSVTGHWGPEAGDGSYIANSASTAAFSFAWSAFRVVNEMLKGLREVTDRMPAICGVCCLPKLEGDIHDYGFVGHPQRHEFVPRPRHELSEDGDG